MQSQIIGLYTSDQNILDINLFGYTSNGLPGLEIIGLGNRGRFIKEKFYYISRIRGIKFPLKKYVLCAEIPPGTAEKFRRDLDWLELPLLLLFWHLTQHIGIHNTKALIAAGKIAPTGRISLLPLPSKYLSLLSQKYDNQFPTRCAYLNLENETEYGEMVTLPLREILGHIPDLHFEFDSYFDQSRHLRS
jgi:hypothetical protein